MRLVEKLRRIAAPQENRLPVRSGAYVPPGGLEEADSGRYWVRRIRLALDHRHGTTELGALACPPLPGFADVAREPCLADVDPGRVVYFDTETTSLGGGVGTYVFLLGVGWFEEDAFVVEQYFLHDMTEERALLHAMNKKLESFDVAVSFHGKGFDAPRLTDRLAFHRMDLTLPDAHLDLCVVGRSLYRGAFGDCRLQTFERELVGFLRADDLPGAECPRAFFNHLQGDSSLIPRVFEHNMHDILTLPAVLTCFAREIAAPEHPVVLANLAAFHEGRGRDREARDLYAAALDGLRSRRHPLLPRSLERLALLERRAGRHAESAALLLERCDMAPQAVQPLEDLSKYYEHRVRDLGRARDAAADARSRLVTGRIQVDPQARKRHLRALDHRIGRLQRRIAAAPGR